MNSRSSALRGDRAELQRLARHFVHHVQEARRCTRGCSRIAHRPADRIAVAGGGDRRHLGDQADRGEAALLRIFEVERVVVEARHRTEHADQHRHRMRVVAEAAKEALEGLVHHRVMRDLVLELRELVLVRQLAVHQQVGDFEEARVLGQLLDRVTAIHQHACVAIDVGDRRLAAGGRGEARIVGEAAGFLRQLRDVDAGLAEHGVLHRQGRRTCRRRSASPGPTVWSQDTPSRTRSTPRRACRGRAGGVAQGHREHGLPRKLKLSHSRFGVALGLLGQCPETHGGRAAQTRAATSGAGNENGRPRAAVVRNSPLRTREITSARNACGTCPRDRWCP